MENINLSPLHSYLRTKSDANKMIVIFEKINEELYKEGYNISEILSKDTSYDFKDNLERVAREIGVNTDDKKEFESFLGTIKEEISNLPIIHIMLPFTPKVEIIAAIHDWFYQNYKKTVLLDISIDSTLIAGSVISFNGRANDYSLKNRIQQM